MINPKTKQFLSALAVAIGGAVLVVLNAYVVHLPEAYQGIAGAILAGIAHYVPALGTADATKQEVAKQVTAAVERES